MKTSTFLVNAILAQFLVVTRGQMDILDSIMGTDNQIVGGQPATITRYPYQVSLQYNGTHSCGGSIITNNKILTAAHCETGRITSLFTVVAGITQLSSASSGQRVAVRRFHIHESFNPETFENDIAIVDIDRLSYSNSVQPIELTDKNVNPNEYVFVTGWGLTSESSTAPAASLQRLNALTYDRQYCARDLGSPIADSQICTIAGKEHGICFGDSGGPVVWVDPDNCNKRVQIGVVSFSEDGCAEGYPDGHAYVPYFMRWIDSKLAL